MWIWNRSLFTNMASLADSDRPPIGRYTLLPSASSWESVAEEKQIGLAPAEGKLVAFNIMFWSRDSRWIFFADKTSNINLTQEKPRLRSCYSIYPVYNSDSKAWRVELKASGSIDLQVLCKNTLVVSSSGTFYSPTFYWRQKYAFVTMI